jgi:peptidoglycan LD-endopeptidase LytH
MSATTRAAYLAGSLVVAFAAGAFTTAAIVWHQGNIIGSPGHAAGYVPVDPTHRWGSREATAPARPYDRLLASGTSGASAPLDVESAPTRPTYSGSSAARATPTIGASPLAGLRDRVLEVPVVGIPRDALRSSFTHTRSGGRAHEAIDILAPRNTPVVAVENGRVVKLFTSAAGGLTIYQFDPDERFAYYYAHLERYGDGIKEGVHVRRGQIIGYVGTSGNAPPNTPHLHFAIFRLGPEKSWWKGDAIDPYVVLR